MISLKSPTNFDMIYQLDMIITNAWSIFKGFESTRA